MAYTTNIPAATDKISTSQPQIQANFNALAAFGNGYGDFTLQLSAPSGSTTTNQIYTLVNADTTKNELYVKKQSNDAPVAVPFTASKMSNTVVASSDNGWSYLPSGVLMKWGSKTNGGTTTNVDVATDCGGPAFNRVFQTLITPYSNVSSVAPIYASHRGAVTHGTTGNFTFQISATTGGQGITYIVIGV